MVRNKGWCLTTLNAYKLTILNRLFYVWPKEFLLWLYFGPLKKKEHAKHLFFHSLIRDVDYAVRTNGLTECPKETQLSVRYNAQTSDWWKKDHYLKKDFHRRVVEKFMWDLDGYIEDKKPRSVIDIGCSNGARIDALAKWFPKTFFYGIDFYTGPAQACNLYRNAMYVEGYPLEMLRHMDPPFDMVFSTQSLLFALPGELKEYFKEFRRLGVKYLAIFDTNINGYTQANDGKLWSKHMGYNTGWCHNYSGYFKEYGYKVTGFSRVLCDFHPSRADYQLVSIFGERA